MMLIWVAPMSPISEMPQHPYLSCIDGHIVSSLSECPPIPSHQHESIAPIGGGPRSRGLLGLGIGIL